MAHGSEPLATYPSDNRMTGVMKRVAMRHASSATSKQSLGLRAATMGSGDSPLRPNIACSRSDCSVFVGRPVLGPPRCMLMTSMGSSRIMPSPIASLFSAMPGPLELVTAIAPPKAAPMAEQIAAISSSACTVRTPKRFRALSSSRTGLAGVIGYEPQNSSLPLSRAAATRPHARAWLPMMFR